MTSSTKKDSDTPSGRHGTDDTRTPDETRTPADALSEEEKDVSREGGEKDRNDMDDELDEMEQMLNEMDEEEKANIEDDPAYQELIARQAQLQKQLSDFIKDISSMDANIKSQTNFILRNRFEDAKRDLEKSKAQVLADLNEV